MEKKKLLIGLGPLLGGPAGLRYIAPLLALFNITAFISALLNKQWGGAVLNALAAAMVVLLGSFMDGSMH